MYLGVRHLLHEKNLAVVSSKENLTLTFSPLPLPPRCLRFLTPRREWDSEFFAAVSREERRTFRERSRSLEKRVSRSRSPSPTKQPDKSPNSRSFSPRREPERSPSPIQRRHHRHGSPHRFVFSQMRNNPDQRSRRRSLTPWRKKLDQLTQDGLLRRSDIDDDTMSAIEGLSKIKRPSN